MSTISLSQPCMRRIARGAARTGVLLLTLALLLQSTPPAGNAAVPRQPGDNVVYLPHISTPPGPPVFVINSPVDGSRIAGTLFFSIQSPNPRHITAVTFRAGTEVLGTDSSRDDGFRIFVDAGALDAGAQILSADATGPTGETTTEDITVEVVANPPGSAVVETDGAVVATEIGSVIGVPPGGAPPGSTISATEKSQAEVTEDTGFDWDTMRVTFLGAQEVQTSAPISQPLMVSSAGFGNRVQPGQVVVNYRILPDADGDGVGELAVVNTASVASNEDVVADPISIPQIQSVDTQSIDMEISSRAGIAQGAAGTVSGPPGTLLRLTVKEFYAGSAMGNRARFQSATGDYFELPGLVIPSPDHPSDPTVQLFTTIIPPLPPGAATLVLYNMSTGQATAPVSLHVESSPPLAAPAQTIVTDFFDFLPAQIQDLEAQINFASFSEEEQALFADQKENVLEAVAAFESELASLDQDDSNVQQALRDFATLIQNSGVMETTHRGAADNGDLEDWKLVGTGIGGSAALIGGGAVIYFKAIAVTGGAAVGVAGATTFFAYAGLALGLLGGIGIAIFIGVALGMLIADLFLTGMGSARPTGGSLVGSAHVSTPVGRSVSQALPDAARQYADRVRQSNGMAWPDQKPGRVVVKVFSPGSPVPFSGLTDAGGYFIVPLVPEGESFTAVALDTETGQSRTFEGIGPAMGDALLTFFDFTSEDSTGLPELHAGARVTGTVGAGNETDLYAFTGVAGMPVLARATRLSGDLDPSIQIYRPDGSLLCEDETFTDWAAVHCQPDRHGTYTLAIGNLQDENSGDYALFLQSTRNPVNAAEITYGSTTAAEIAAGGELDSFTFQGATSESILVRMTATAGEIDPYVQVYRPDGSLLCEQGTFTDWVAHNCTLDQDGQHTIVTGDWRAANTGDYALHLQRTNDPADAAAITYGTTTAAEIATGGELDSFAFKGATGESILVRMTATAGEIDPYVQVYRPDGSLLCEQGTFTDWVAHNCTLDQDGQHTIVTGDWRGANTGDYALHLQRTNDPADAAAITYGTTTAAEIATGGELDSFAFQGDTGESILVRMTATAGDVDPYFQIYRPDGMLLCEQGTFTDWVAHNCTLDQDGQHTIVTGDWRAANTGEYALHLQRTTGPVNAITLTTGVTTTGTIDPPGEVDAFTVEVTAGAQVQVRMLVTAGNLDPHVQVFAPDGALLCESGSFTDSTSATCSPGEDGIYTVLTGDHSGANTGDYELFVSAP